MTKASWSDYGTYDESAYPEFWDGVVGAWCPSLGPTGSRLFDHSRVNNWGTLTNMDNASDWVISGGQYVLDFDGTNDHVSVPSAGLRFTGPQCVSMWVNWRSITVANIPTVFGLQDTTSPFLTQMNAGINTIGHGTSNNTSRFTVNAYDGTLANGVWGSAYTSTTFASRLNEWIHFVFGWTGSTWKIYVNGIDDTVVDGTNGPSAMTSTNSVFIGSSSASARFFDGRLDDIQFRRRMLTAGEVQDLYLLGRAGMFERRRRSRRRAIEQAGFRAYWVQQKSRVIGGGV